MLKNYVNNEAERRRALQKMYSILANTYIDEIFIKDSFLSYWNDRKAVINSCEKFVLENFEEC